MKDAGSIRDFVHQLADACAALRSDIFTIGEFLLFVVALGLVIGSAARLHGAAPRKSSTARAKRAWRRNA